MDSQGLIAKTATFVEDTLKTSEGSHDWFHVWRVWRNARTIGAAENVDMLVVELGALLHDIADAKFHDGDETIGPRMAVDFLRMQQADGPLVSHIEQIIANISFRGAATGNSSARRNSMSSRMPIGSMPWGL